MQFTHNTADSDELHLTTLHTLPSQETEDHTGNFTPTELELELELELDIEDTFRRLDTIFSTDLALLQLTE